jgi:hypothetical protein
MNDRNTALNKLFYDCSVKFNEPKIKNMLYMNGDRGIRSIKYYSMTYHKKYPEYKKYCGPDWTFINWPSAKIISFKDTCDKIIKESNNLPIINKAAWFGNIHSPRPDVIEHKTRPLLVQISKQYPDLIETEQVFPNGSDKNYISLEELTKYKYLIDIGGNGYSGRLKYLMFSKRPILFVERNYIEYFNDDLIPYIHYIPVKMDLSDLITQIEWANNNEEQCKQIAINAFNYAIENFTYDKILEKVYEVYQNINYADIKKIEENFINSYNSKIIRKIIIKNIHAKQKI